jgi:hypothetical protein
VLSHLRAGICPVRTRRHNISLIQPYPASGSFVRLQFITIDRAVALLIIASIRPDGRVLHASSCVPVGNKLHRRACEKHEREREVEDAYKFEAHACMRAQVRSIGSDVYSTAEEGTRSDHHRVRTCNNVVLPPL